MSSHNFSQSAAKAQFAISLNRVVYPAIPLKSLVQPFKFFQSLDDLPDLALGANRPILQISFRRDRLGSNLNLKAGLESFPVSM